MRAIGASLGTRRGGIAALATVVVIASFAALVLAPSSARAQQGGPDACGYAWTDSNTPPPQVPFSWIEIKDNGTLIEDADWVGNSDNNSDDGYLGVPLGFSMPFYDASYSDLFIGTNGYATFGAGSVEWNLPPIPDPRAPNNAAFGYGEDLRPGIATGQGGVYYLPLTSPSRLVAEWYQVPHYGGADPVTFEIIFFDTGEIWFQYLSLSGPLTVVGIENVDGAIALDYGTNVSANLAVHIARPTTVPGPVGVDLKPCGQAVQARPGSTADARVSVTNTGSGTDTFDMTFSSPSGWSATFYESDGSTPLPDSDTDGTPDTGALAAGASVDVILRADVPTGASASETVSVTGTSAADSGVSDTVQVLFDIPPAALAPPHFDHGLDTNANGQYDYLLIDINITVNVADTYVVQALLHDASYVNLYANNNTFVSLPVGPATVTLGYNGQQINASGVDGPYLIDIQLFRLSGFTLLDMATNTTQAYSHLDFETPPAAWNPPHWEHLRDTDGDGLANHLVVIANLTVYQAGLFQVFGELFDASGTLFTYEVNVSSLPTGPASVELDFTGYWINGSNMDGPYNVLMFLSSFSPGLNLGTSTLTTAPYRHTQFEEPPRIDAPFAVTAPRIDGAIVGLEWAGASRVDLSGILGNSLNGFMYVESDYSYVYVAYDVVGDTTADTYDTASIGFDTGNDGIASDGHEDALCQGCFVNGSFQSHWVYRSAYFGWVLEDAPYDPSLPNHTGLASAEGFGPSSNSGTNHRIYEFSIPLALLDAQAGDTIGFYGGSAVTGTGVWDYSTFRSSSWPDVRYLPIYALGDLGLAPDTTPPTVTITSPTSGTLFTVNSVTVTWSGSDVGTGVDHYTIQVDADTPITLPASASSHTLTSLADGTRTINVTAWDGGGNSASSSIEVIVDTTGPTVSITAPGAGAFLASASVQVTWTASDAATALDHFDIRIDGGSTNTLPGSATDYTFSGLADGSHAVELTAFDGAGHSTVVTRSFTVDTVAPSFTLTAPATGFVGTRDVVVTWAASDATSGIDHVDVSLDGTIVPVPGGVTTHTLTGVADGPHTILVTVYDGAGNSASASVAVTVDATGPTVSISGPGSGAVVTSSSTTVQWSAADTTSGVDHIELRIDGGSPQTLSASTTSQSLTGLSDGSHTVTITVVDRAGNTATASVTFRVDTGFFSPSGPYGYAGIGAVLFALIAVVVLAVLFLRRRRGAMPPPDEI